MTRIRFQCSRCQTVIKASPEHAGKRARCPNVECGNILTIPLAADAPAPPQSVVKKPAAAQKSASPAPKTTGSIQKTKPLPPRPEPAVPLTKPKPVVEKKPKHGKGKRRKKSLHKQVFWFSSVVLVAVIAAVAMKLSKPGSQSLQASVVTPEEQQFRNELLPFVKKYCCDCHNLQSQDGGLSLDQYQEFTAIRSDRRVWEKVLARLKIGAMPPSEAPQPSKEDREQISDWLHHRLFDVNCGVDYDPGRVTIRRLNRFQYNNTIRDLIGIDFQPAANFPSDDIGYGFDNNGDVLSVPPLLVEKYLDAAEQITKRAIVTENPKRAVTLRDAKNLQKEGHVSDGAELKALAGAGSVFDSFEFSEDNEYLIQIVAEANQAGDERAKLELRVDDKAEQVFDIQGEKESNTIERRVALKPGKHRISAAFINDFFDAATKGDRNLYVRSIAVDGPLKLADRTTLPPAHQKIITFVPNETTKAEDAALGNLRNFLYRAFRRPVNDAEAMQYAKFVKLAIERGETYERGMQIAMQAVLVSPDFLFRVEHQVDRQGNPRGELSDFELASRLSYFLWGSMPDDELLESARLGKLHETAELDRQFQRLLTNDRTQAFINDFSSQWLGLTKFNTDDVAPDPEKYPQFTPQLRDAMREESMRFFGAVVRENRSVVELIDGRFTFLNEDLAKLYGIPNVTGKEFRRVELTDRNRGGLITQASVLTLTSYPTRTSPVKRGEWVLANILGEAPPPPPPVVPGLEETQKSNPNLPLRKQLELHRADPGCASCHHVMDDIGFGLEHFDAIGRWRDRDGNFDIDSQGTLPTGEAFSSPKELLDILRKREGQFTRCLSEKVLTYALGRGLEYYDKCTLDEICTKTAADGHKLSSVLRNVVLSNAFRARRAD